MAPHYIFASAFVVLAAVASPVFAQSANDQALAAAKNQLGMLEFCQSKGFADAGLVSRQAEIFAQLPAAADRGFVDQAYSKGQRGVLSAMGVEQNFDDAARQQGLDAEGLCKQISSLARRGA